MLVGAFHVVIQCSKHFSVLWLLHSQGSRSYLLDWDSRERMQVGLEVGASLLLIFYWLEAAHETTPHCEGGWQM